MTYKEYDNVELESSGTSCPVTIGIGGRLWGQYHPYKQIYNPYISGDHQTLGNVTSLIPRLLQKGYGEGWTKPRAQLTTNYAFIDSLETGCLNRYPIAGLSPDAYKPDIGQIIYFEVYSEDVVYTLENILIGANYYHQLCRITFIDGMPSKEVIHQVAENFSSDGHNWVYWEPFLLEHVKYESNDAIVFMLEYYDDNNVTMVYTVIYDINYNTTTIDIEITPENGWLYGATEDVSPSFYKNYLVYTSIVDPENPIEGEEIIVIITYVIDIVHKTVTSVNKTVNWVEEPHQTNVYIYYGSGMVDYTTGIYYYEYMISDPESNYEDRFTIAQIDLKSIPFTVEIAYVIGEYYWDYFMTSLPTDGKPYMMNGEYMGSSPEFYSSPYISNVAPYSLLKPIDLNLDLYENFCTDIVDIPQYLVWNITDTNLEGIDLLNSNDREISINWSGSSLPFMYPNSNEKRVYLQILDNVALVGIYSKSYPNYQFDWYLLRESYSFVTNVFRNSGVILYDQVYCDEDRYTARTANINGDAITMLYNPGGSDGTSMGGVVRNSDYIYFARFDSVNKNVYIREYRISTSTYTDILAYTWNTNYAPEVLIALIENRKVFTCLPNWRTGASYPYTYYDRFYIVDFEAGTSTLEMEYINSQPQPDPVPDPWEIPVETESIKCILKDDGDIWLYIIGWHYTHYPSDNWDYTGGVFIFYKNYTENSDWEYAYMDTSHEIGHNKESIMYQDPIFINKDYLVVIGSTSFDYGSHPGGFTGYAFNLNTNTFSKSEDYINPDYWIEPLCYYSSPANSEGVLYFQAYEFYDAGTACMKFDPEILEISTIYTADDPDLDWDILTFSSRTEAYFLDGATNYVYNARNLVRMGDITSDFGYDSWDWTYGIRCQTLDDNNLSVWWYDTTNELLKQTSIYGGTLNSYSLSVTMYRYSAIFHLGDCLVVEAFTGYGPGGEMLYYLIT